MHQEKTGYVHLYVGDGKGKTTAAAGLAARALGSGKKVLFCQFLKARPTSEITSLSRLGAEILRAEHIGKFTFQMTPEELSQAGLRHKDCLREAGARIAGGDVDLLVLDESVDAVNAGLFSAEALLDVVRGRPSHVEVVLTGRNPDALLCEAADYHTDFLCRKHPFQKGVSAREGIEY